MESTRRERRYEESELENDYLVDKDGNMTLAILILINC